MNSISDLAYLLYSNSRLLIQKIQVSLDEVGLTYTQYLTLAVLWEQDGQYVNQIGKKLELDSGTLTPLLKKLEAQNYLRRIRSEEDERKVKVELTYPGKTLQGKVEELLKVFSEELELISDPQLEKLNSSLSGMLSKLKSLD
ncbi:MarR family winged helix-turn-helix transcriptional regulator [Algoriphagus formosus]|uniref:HTH-type transcriptional regulator SarZ n=1 Tax=Algoriphagus formosus TaxID=2007308 RepID=A0A4R5V187_9BACT|nr:MarR family transcriptional regulator [Algoriphagus aquimaris]TDK45540.1 MarR family transcriptional regulator [Algoriphagus aquimaris]